MISEEIRPKPRLRWRKAEMPSGLARISYGYLSRRAFELWYGDQRLADARPNYKGWSRVQEGYSWCCGSFKEFGIERRNTMDKPVATIDEAKAACEAYVRQCLGLPAKKIKEKS